MTSLLILPKYAEEGDDGEEEEEEDGGDDVYAEYGGMRNAREGKCDEVAGRLCEYLQGVLQQGSALERGALERGVASALVAANVNLSFKSVLQHHCCRVVLLCCRVFVLCCRVVVLLCCVLLCCCVVCCCVVVVLLCCCCVVVVLSCCFKFPFFPCIIFSAFSSFDFEVDDR